MSAMYKIAAAVFLSIGIAWLLSFLPEIDSTGTPVENVVTSGPAFAKELSDENIVDMMLGLQIHAKLAKVDWSNQILAVDLKWLQLPHDANLIYDDVIELVRFAFVDTTNVKQVLLRVKLADSNSIDQMMLLALEGKRELWSKEMWEDVVSGKLTPEKYLRSVFNLSTTKLDEMIRD